MKNIIITICSIFMMMQWISAQEMTWLPADYIAYGGCENLTDCDQNIVCYKLQYTPQTSGVLTSYTTGFFADCQEGETSLIENSSCFMPDNSRQLEACQQVGKILMNCSGNSGSGIACRLEVGIAVILHQVCFDVKDGNHVMITEDETTDLTTSLDLSNEMIAKTEFPSYVPYQTNNEQICDNPPGDLTIDVGYVPEVSWTSVEWTPTAETGNGTYEVEHSLDGISFEKITVIKDRTFDTNRLTYQFVDEKAEYGYNFYRTIYTDNNGVKQVSNIASIYVYDGHFSMSIYPNPAKEVIHLNVNIDKKAFQYSLFDIKGQLIKQELMDRLPENKINIRALKSGVYTLVVKAEEQSISEQFIKVE